MTTEQETTSDLLDSAAQDVASEAIPPEETPEAIAPSYVTREEAQSLAADAAARAATSATEQASRHFQGVADRRVSQVEEQFKAFKQDIELKERRQQDAYIASLPPEDQPAVMAKIAYDRTYQQPQQSPMPQPEVQAQPQQQEIDPQLWAMIQGVAIAEGVSAQDGTLYTGMLQGLSNEQNIRTFRDNINKRRSPTQQTAPTTPQPQSRRPEQVPVRSSPAAGAGQLTREEAELWVTRTGGQLAAANNAFLEMERREQSEL